MSTLLSDSPVALPHPTFTGSERPHHSLLQDMFPEQKASQDKCWPSGPNTDSLLLLLASLPTTISIPMELNPFSSLGNKS